MFQFSSATICGVGFKNERVRDKDIAMSRTYGSAYQKQFAQLDRQGTVANLEDGLAAVTSAVSDFQFSQPFHFHT